MQELRRDAVLRWTLFALTALTLADVLTTAIGFAEGAHEGNPLAVGILARLSFAGLVAVKLGYCVAAIYILALTARVAPRRARVVGLLCCAIVAAIVGHNLLLLTSVWTR